MTCWQILRSWAATPLARLALGTLLGLLVLQVSEARADSSVVVLGVRSLDGDDELAREVSQALRDAAKTLPAWKISDRDVSLAQMSLAHGCDEPDARCMADIASTLEVDRLIYGTMLRSDTTTEVSLFNFDAVTGQVESSITEKVPSDALVGVALKGTAATLAKRLAGIEPKGALRVRGNAPSARVLLDNKEVGVLDARGELLLAGIAAGKHNLRVVKGDAQNAQEIEIREAETTTSQLMLEGVTLTPPEDPESSDEPNDRPRQRNQPPNLRRILGFSAIGLGGAFLVATGYTWYRIDAINDSDDLTTYRKQFTSSTNVCNAARDGALKKSKPNYGALEDSAADLCDRADTLEILQYVFLGSALVAGGVGAYLLLTEKKAGARHSLSLQPHFARGRGSVSATLRF